jgi:toxin-antitoxin system, toxin component, bro family
MEQKFEFKGNLVRMKTDENEQYWFAGIDVCNILGLENPTQTVESLDSDEKKLDYVIDSSGQQRKTWTINEFGLYSLVLKSRKLEAKEFKRWITHEVLPAIRKAGRYTTEEERAREDELQKIASEIQVLTSEKDDLQKRLNEKKKLIEKKSLGMLQIIQADFRQLRLPFSE